MRKLLSLYPALLYRLSFLHIIFLASIAVFMSSCGEEPNFVGRDLLPPGEDINLVVDSSSLIQAYTATAKPINTTSNSSYLLGSINSPVFGFSESKIVTQIGLASTLTFGTAPVLDSLFITLKVSGYYGDSLYTQRLNVHEITENIKTDSSYFSNSSVEGQYSPFIIGTTEFMAKDTLIKISVTDQNFIYKFLTAPDSTFLTSTKLKEVFKGLYFTCEPKPETGGAIMYIDLSSVNSKMTLYYTEGVTLSKSYAMSFTGSVNAFNIFNNSYENSPPLANLNNPDSQDTVLFLTAMAGLNVHLKFPELSSWKEKGAISIIKAELTIGVDDLAFEWNSSKLYPQSLFLFYINEQGNYSYLYDYNINQNGFGGTYLSGEKAYKFNIAHHLQSYITGKIENFELVIIPTQSNATASRVILKSPLATGKNRLKLKVIYTQL